MGACRFIIIDAGTHGRPRNRARPVVVSIPDTVKDPGREKAKEFIQFALRVTGQDQYVPILCEHDTAQSPEISAMFAAVDWASAERIGTDFLTNAEFAYEYVKMVGAPVPELEPLIAADCRCAYLYAMNVVGAFQAGEKAIAGDLRSSVDYSERVGVRIMPAEDNIAKVDSLAARYGVAMGKHRLWGSWTEDELVRSPVWIYQYAKDHVGGPLPETLHNAMHLLSIQHSVNEWIKKYFSAKKYRPKGTK